MTQSSNSEVMNVSGNNNGGCFICGEKGHGFRTCPKRSDNRSQGPPSSSSRPIRKGAYWVESLTPSSLDTVFMATPEDENEAQNDLQTEENFNVDFVNDEHDKPILDTFNLENTFNVVSVLNIPEEEKPEHCIYMTEDAEVINDTTGYGVLDLGATETVCSLEALEGLMQRRAQVHGIAEPVEVFSGRDATKPFRFGNGATQVSSSFVRVPQRLGDQMVKLGLFTLDAERVPILLGMRTLHRLGAIIDVSGRWMVLSRVAPSVKIPLGKSRAGHLLVDLTCDWLKTSQPLQDDFDAKAAYMVQPLSELHTTCSTSCTLHTSCTTSCDRLSSVVDEVARVSEASAWVVSEAEGESGEQHEEHDFDPAFVVHSSQTSQSSLPEVDQSMRDYILRQLAHDQAHRTAFSSNGAEEADPEPEPQGRSSPDREVRLHTDATDEPSRPEGSGSALLGRAHSSPLQDEEV